MPLEPEILLVQPMQGEYTRKAIFQPGVEIPLNLTSLATYVEAHGIHAKILDLRTEENPLEKLTDTLQKRPPPLIGISAYSSEIEVAGRIACDIKNVRPEIPVIIGGYHATAEPEETLRNCEAFDYLIHGEGERAFHGLASRSLNGQEILSLPGLAYRSGDRIAVNPRQPLIEDLDSLPFNHRDKLDLSRYLPSPGTGNFLRLPSTGIMASRGCPYNCYYCSKGVWGTHTRFRSKEHVLAEMEYCIERHGMRDFRFYDDVLPLPSWDLKGFCHRLIEGKMDVSWNCYSRVNLTKREPLHLMKRAGCYHIKYGIEFGTETSLKRSNKRTTLEQAREAVRLTKEAGIECKCNFILGIPGESEEDCRDTVRFALELAPDLASFYPFYPAPGSVFAKRIRNDPETARKLLPTEERERLAREAYRKFYLRPGFIMQRTRRLLRYPVREARMLGNAARMMGAFYLRRAAATLKGRIQDGGA